MMSDCVEDWEDDGHVCQECERLTVRNKNQYERLDQQIKHNADLLNRNAKLRAALVAIRDHPEEDGVADSMEAIARTALEDDDDDS